MGQITKSNIDSHQFIKLQKHLFTLTHSSRYPTFFSSFYSLLYTNNKFKCAFVLIFNIVGFLLNIFNSISTFKTIMFESLAVITFNICFVKPSFVWPWETSSLSLSCGLWVLTSHMVIRMLQPFLPLDPFPWPCLCLDLLWVLSWHPFSFRVRLYYLMGSKAFCFLLLNLSSWACKDPMSWSNDQRIFFTI